MQSRAGRTEAGLLESRVGLLESRARLVESRASYAVRAGTVRRASEGEGTDGTTVGAAVEGFLEVESRGWYGRVAKVATAYAERNTQTF